MDCRDGVPDFQGSTLLTAVINLISSYQINAQTELAIRYNDISPLENHHAAVAFEVIGQVGRPQPVIVCVPGHKQLACIQSRLRGSFLTTNLLVRNVSNSHSSLGNKTSYGYAKLFHKFVPLNSRSRVSNHGHFWQVTSPEPEKP